MCTPLNIISAQYIKMYCKGNAAEGNILRYAMRSRIPEPRGCQPTLDDHVRVYVANRYLGVTVAAACIKQHKRQHK
jgi:hypothetical protein